MNSTMKNQKGFTLVEMIVVIAIIAILAAVVIPATVGFIDRARLSNDQTFASQATRTLEFAVVEDQSLLDEQLDAYTVKQIIHESSGEDLDWTPQSRNAGFFFIQNELRIIVAKYADMADGTALDAGEFRLHNAIFAQSSPGNSPEELFGSGKFLLTTEGHIVPEIVNGIRNLALSNDLESDYNSMVARVAGLSGLTGIFRSTEHQERLENILGNFDPDRTLFVNNRGWVFTEKAFEFDKDARSAPHQLVRDYRTIVFAPGITNIPSFPTQTYRPNVENIVIPPTVRTIETGSFAAFNPNLGITLSRTNTVNIETGAFRSAHSNELRGYTNLVLNYSPPASTIVVSIGNQNFTFPGAAPLNLTNAENVKFNISGIPREVMSEFKVMRNASGYDVKVYSAAQGLIGLTHIPVLDGLADMSTYRATIAAEANNEELYTEASWIVYQDVIDANIVGQAHTQQEVQDATDNILSAQEDLVKNITIYEVEGVTRPVSGENPVTEITETSEFTGSITWEPDEDPFKDEKAYTAKITLTAKIGYSFEDLPEAFFNVDGATVTFDSEKGIITAEFPETDAP